MTNPTTSNSALARLRTPVRDEPGERKDAPTLRFLRCRFDGIKLAGAGTEQRFTGYGAAFGNIDVYGDSIERGAFKRTLREAKQSGAWPAMLSQHGGFGLTADDLTPVGLWSELDEDDRGLKSAGILAPTPRGSELYTLLTMQPRPAIDGLSIGYVPRKWRTNAAPKEGEPRRVLTDVDLIEISLVTFPANQRARVTDLKQRPTCVRELEHALREIGLSSREAKRAASAAWPTIASEQHDASHELAAAIRLSADRFACTN